MEGRKGIYTSVTNNFLVMNTDTLTKVRLIKLTIEVNFVAITSENMATESNGLLSFRWSLEHTLGVLYEDYDQE